MQTGFANIGDHGHYTKFRKRAPQFSMDLEHLVLVVVERHQGRRAERGNLSARLTADGAAGTGDQYRLARRELPNGGDVGDDRLAAQEIVDLDVPECIDLDAAGDHIVQPGDRGRPDPCIARGPHDLTHDRPARVGHGDDDFIDAQTSDEPGMCSTVPSTGTPPSS